MRINKKLYIPASISSGLILFLILISSAASAAPVTCNVAGTNYQYEYFGQYPVINLFGEKYVPILNDDNPIWKSHVNKLAKLVLDTNTKFNLKTGEKLDLGQGYALEAKQIDVDGKRVWLEFTKDGEYVDDQLFLTDDGTWTCKLDNVQDEDDVPVLKVHVNKIYQGAVDSIAQIDGLWLIDYANTTNLKVGDKFKGYTLTKINNGVKQSNLGSLVFEVPHPVAAFSATPTSGISPLKVTFTDKSTNSPTSWKWSFGDGSTSNVQKPTHTYSKAGKYSVSLTVKNSAGSNTMTKSNYISVTAVTKPVAAFYASPTSGKVPLTVVFKDKSTGSPTSWRWSFGDGAIKTSQNPTHKYTKKGIYTVSLTVKNAAGSNTITKSKYITVK